MLRGQDERSEGSGLGALEVRVIHTLLEVKSCFLLGC